MRPLGRRRLALGVGVALLVAEGIFLGAVAAALYSLRGLNLSGTEHPDIAAQVQFVQLMALWAAVHLVVAAAAALWRGAAWRVTAGAVQLIDFLVTVILAANGPGTPVEVLAVTGFALVPLAGAAVVLVPLGSPPTSAPGDEVTRDLVPPPRRYTPLSRPARRSF